jgi:hypothetical protein
VSLFVTLIKAFNAGDGLAFWRIWGSEESHYLLRKMHPREHRTHDDAMARLLLQLFLHLWFAVSSSTIFKSSETAASEFSRLGLFIKSLHASGTYGSFVVLFPLLEDIADLEHAAVGTAECVFAHLFEESWRRWVRCKVIVYLLLVLDEALGTEAAAEAFELCPVDVEADEEPLPLACLACNSPCPELFGFNAPPFVGQCSLCACPVATGSRGFLHHRCSNDKCKQQSVFCVQCVTSNGRVLVVMDDQDRFLMATFAAPAASPLTDLQRSNDALMLALYQTRRREAGGGRADAHKGVGLVSCLFGDLHDYLAVACQWIGGVGSSRSRGWRHSQIISRGDLNIYASFSFFTLVQRWMRYEYEVTYHTTMSLRVFWGMQSQWAERSARERQFFDVLGELSASGLTRGDKAQWEKTSRSSSLWMAIYILLLCFDRGDADTFWACWNTLFGFVTLSAEQADKYERMGWLLLVHFACVSSTLKLGEGVALKNMAALRRYAEDSVASVSGSVSGSVSSSSSKKKSDSLSGAGADGALPAPYSTFLALTKCRLPTADPKFAYFFSPACTALQRSSLQDFLIDALKLPAILCPRGHPMTLCTLAEAKQESDRPKVWPPWRPNGGADRWSKVSWSKGGSFAHGRDDKGGLGWGTAGGAPAAGAGAVSGVGGGGFMGGVGSTGYGFIPGGGGGGGANEVICHLCSRRGKHLSKHYKVAWLHCHICNHSHRPPIPRGTHQCTLCCDEKTEDRGDRPPLYQKPPERTDELWLGLQAKKSSKVKHWIPAKNDIYGAPRAPYRIEGTFYTAPDRSSSSLKRLAERSSKKNAAPSLRLVGSLPETKEDDDVDDDGWNVQTEVDL